MILNAALYGLIALSIFSPWMIKNTLCYRMPLAPYRVFRHLYMATGLFGGRGAPAPSKAASELSERNALLYKGVYPRSSFRDFLLIPYNATIYGEWPSQVFDTLVAPFYLMFLPFAFFIRRKKRVTMALLIYIFTVYFQWHVIQPITRYLLPVMIPMSVLAAFVIHRVAGEGHSLNRLIGHALKSIVIVTLLIALVHQVLIFTYLNPLLYLLGYETRSSYLTRSNPARIQPAIDYANENLPPDAKVLLLWEKRGYYLERKYQEDASGNVLAVVMYQTRDPGKAAEKLKEMGYTHILCDVNLPQNWMGSSYKEGMENTALKEIGKRELEFFQDMADKHMTLLIKSDTIHLFIID